MIDYKNTSEERIEKHIDHLIDIAKSLEPGKITILTGGNAMGKSVIRKLASEGIRQRLGLENAVKVSSVSMQGRTEDRYEFGALSGALHDLPWSSTSDHTVSLLKNLLKEDTKDRYIVIDEVEIGMSKEVQLGTCLYLNSVLPTVLQQNYGVLVITHSDIVVTSLMHDRFINIEGLDEAGWLGRKITPVDPEELKTWSLALFKGIQKREKK